MRALGSFWLYVLFIFVRIWSFWSFACCFLIGSSPNYLHLPLAQLMSYWGLKGSLAVWSTLMHLIYSGSISSCLIRYYLSSELLTLCIFAPLSFGSRHALGSTYLVFLTNVRILHLSSSTGNLRIWTYLETHPRTLATLPEDSATHFLVPPPLRTWLLLEILIRKKNKDQPLSLLKSSISKEPGLTSLLPSSSRSWNCTAPCK